MRKRLIQVFVYIRIYGPPQYVAHCIMLNVNKWQFIIYYKICIGVNVI